MRLILNKSPFALLIAFTLFQSCVGEASKRTEEKLEYSATELVKYAEGFKVERNSDYSKVTILNPWTGYTESYETYYLYKDDSILSKLPDKDVKLKIPISSLTVNTFAYFEFLDLLGESGIITGVTDGFRIYNKDILLRMESGDIVNLGDPFHPNLERTMELRPEAIITSAYAQMDKYSERLLQVGFPIIYSLEWMETTPLARAEWIKMIASFFDKNVLADSIFGEIEKQYIEVSKKVEPSKRYSVMSGDMFQDTWYVPGGNSYNAALFKDARLDYLYADNDDSGSIGLDIESILTLFGKSDVWFGCSVDTYAKLADKDSKYLLLQPVKNRKVFNNHNRITKEGGNDYFESAIANPHLVLSDLIKAAYPDMLPEHEFVYIKALE